MKPWLILINDFAHDLFTGLWFGSFVTMGVIHFKTGSGLDASQAVLAAELIDIFFWLTFIALGLIILTGAMRATYVRQWDSVAMAPVKKRLLVIKHAVLGSLLLIGTIFVYFWGT
jgi:hypothetical protein